MLFILSVFHLEMSGNDLNDVNPSNKPLILLIFSVFQFDISGNDINELHPLNISLISVTLLISKKSNSKYFKFLQFSNILFIILTFLVLNDNKSISFILHP